MAVNVRPDRGNWQQFCQEPPLTDEEMVTWDRLAKAIKTAYLVNSTQLDDFIAEMTAGEMAELRQQEEHRTEDWSDMVAWADASRRLKRAEIVAWKAWQARAAVAKARGA